MPDLREVVILGLLQGPAELAPVSSSAHAELVPWLLGWRLPGLEGEERKEVEVALHAGTALALAARPSSRPSPWLAALSVAPPALAGLLLERPIQARLGSPATIAAGLLAGAIALLAADRGGGARRADGVRPADALWLGLAQSCALMPGVSRSAAVLCGARARGFDRPGAVVLARRTALPVLAAASALKLVRLARRRPPRSHAAALTAGVVAAGASSALALRAEGAFARVPFAAWAGYRVALAAAVLAVRQNRRS